MVDVPTIYDKIMVLSRYSLAKELCRVIDIPSYIIQIYKGSKLKDIENTQVPEKNYLGHSEKLHPFISI